MEDTTDANYTHGKGVCKEFQIKNLGEYHDLYSQSNRLCLVSWNIWTWPFSFSYCISISMASSHKKTKVKLYLLTNIDMLLICYWYVIDMLLNVGM